MIKEITMPAGGQTTDASTIGTWMVKKGDKVRRGDELLEVETDKATLAVESFANGVVLAILAETGDEVSAGTAIAYIGDENDIPEVEARLNGAENENIIPNEDYANTHEEVQVKEEAEEYQPIDKNAPARKKPEPIKAMPNAKLLAKREAVELEAVAESVGKQILKRSDVEEYLKKQQMSKQLEESQDEVIPMTTMRKVIASRMLESTQNIPDFQVVVELKMQQCIGFRKKANEGDFKLSYNDIFCKCVEAAIRKYPQINASYSEKGIVLHKDVNVGLAVSVDGGLVVPVVFKVNEKNIGELSAINTTNIQKAREGMLAPEEMSGGTITISNMGMYPVRQFNAVINPPEVCILAIASVEEKPVYIKGEWISEPVMKVTGTFDHRVVDGAYAAQFLSEFKNIVENPALALL